jgi:subtilisin-like proprotein convertase family protein
MKLNFFRRIERLARFFRPQPAPRPAGRPRFRPVLEVLEDRAVPSTLSVVNLGSGPGIEAGSSHALVAGSNSSQMTASASPAVSGPAASDALVFQSTDVPVALNPSDVFVSSVINIPQNVTIGNVKVQVNITYPVDSNLRIDLFYIDSNGFLRKSLVLSDFVGNGANFQYTIFDDAAATPIAAGAPPFAGSYRPSDPLSTLAGQNAQGTWVLEVGDFVGGSGTINSWSLIIQPAASPNTATGTAAQHLGTSSLVTAPSPSLVPTGTVSPAHLPMAEMSGQRAGGTAVMSASFNPADLLEAGLNTALTSPTSPAAGKSLMGGPAAMRSPPAGAESGLVQPDVCLHTSSGIHVRDGGPGKGADANIRIDTGFSGSPANGVNGNVAL